MLKISLNGWVSTHRRIRVLVFNCCVFLCLLKNEPLDTDIFFAFSETNHSVLISVTEPSLFSEGFDILLYLSVPHNK